MDTLVHSVAIAALTLDGLLAGMSLDKVVVQLPARHRMGAAGYAGYARAADLGNGLVFYPLMGVSAAAATLAAFVVAMVGDTSSGVHVLLGVAAALAVIHSIVTGAGAAPTMLRIRTAEDTQRTLERLLTRFARLSAGRAVLQVAAFAVMIAVVISAC